MVGVILELLKLRDLVGGDGLLALDEHVGIDL